jgi:hypothetical protein
MSATKRALEREAAKQAEQVMPEPKESGEAVAPDGKQEPKQAPKAKQPKEQPKSSAATVKVLSQLEEISKEITRLEGLKKTRTDLINKAHAAKVPTADISKASGLSVPRLRQVMGK